MTPEDILARVLYRDGLVLVIDKPHGIAVHRGPKGGASLEDDFDALRFGLPRNPALAHRLDRETSGCLVLGRHHKALEKLGKLLRRGGSARTIGPSSRAARRREGLIDKPLGRRDDSGWWMQVDAQGQKAQTLWRVKGRGTWRGAPIAWSTSAQTGRAHSCTCITLRRAHRSLATPSTGRARTCRLDLLTRKVMVPLGIKGRRFRLKRRPPPTC